MGVTYQRLLSPGSRPRGGGGGGRARARAWVLLRWAAVRLSCAARRRYWCGGRSRRLAWAGLCGRGTAPAAAAAERGKRRSTAAAGYDSASYARNFDDGAWKAEEGVSWAGTGGAFARASVSDAMSTGDPIPSSTS
ncbi:uncharacterized protein LOC133899279 [Phragmites australis]|uniref:uncharacterized protein LOC133899279 n=1 Tax=Phragmites australis TaxID=29695 RepID=UPI002D771660|nr:uncharacterized protein LOC133899279 [Phragmites australis]